jgi:hypothetical protein
MSELESFAVQEVNMKQEAKELVVNGEKWLDYAFQYQNVALKLKTMVEDIALTSNESYTVERAKIALDNFNKQLKEIHKNA